MKRQLEFVIPGEPISQGRPRFSTHGGFARAYDPKKSRDGKAMVKLCARDAVSNAEWEEPLSGPIEMMIQFGIALPKSQYRKRTPVPRQWRTKKPDLDNLMKLVKDACSGVVFLDDNQVVRVVAEKIQCGQDEAPFTKVRFSELGDL
jgi:Holliday junction resolvase RusA-like endonuclease